MGLGAHTFITTCFLVMFGLGLIAAPHIANNENFVHNQKQFILDNLNEVQLESDEKETDLEKLVVKGTCYLVIAIYFFAFETALLFPAWVQNEVVGLIIIGIGFYSFFYDLKQHDKERKEIKKKLKEVEVETKKKLKEVEVADNENNRS